jgi:hypothetical protein
MIDAKVLNPDKSLYEIRKAIFARYPPEATKMKGSRLAGYLKGCVMWCACLYYKMLVALCDEVRNPILTPDILLPAHATLMKPYIQYLLVSRNTSGELLRKRAEAILLLGDPCAALADRISKIYVIRKGNEYFANIDLNDGHIAQSNLKSTPDLAIIHAAMKYLFPSKYSY